MAAQASAELPAQSVRPEWVRARTVLDELVRDIHDFPEPGVVFKDITPVLADPAGFGAIVAGLATAGRDADGSVVVDKVVGMEARGFILGAPVALDLGVGFVPVRKAGKLPGETYSISYALEYGHATLELHCDAIKPGERVLLVDDVLATGGTAAATVDLIRRCGGVPVAFAGLVELSFLDGRNELEDLAVHSMLIL